MKLTIERAVEQLQFCSEKLSDVCRQLAFGVFAIAWIFKVTTDQGHDIPDVLVLSTAIAVSALAMDILQYLWSVTFLIKDLGKVDVSDVNKNTEIQLSPFGKVSSILFFGKILLVVMSYTLVLYFFLDYFK